MYVSNKYSLGDVSLRVSVTASVRGEPCLWEGGDLGLFRSCHWLPADLGRVTGSGLPPDCSGHG